MVTNMNKVKSTRCQFEEAGGVRI